MKDFSFSKVEHFRCERKFYVKILRTEEVEILLKFHPAMFREIYHRRTVNNIYFDSFDLEQYYDNINGEDRRLKVRIRWYGELFGFIERPILELKLKHNFHIGKLLYPLKSFTLDNNFSIDIMRQIFKESDLSKELKFHLMGLNFSLLNSYERKYFLSSDRKFRITLDMGMQVFKLSPYQNTFLFKFTDDSTIVEVKYNKPNEDFVGSITNYFPFRMTRSSKYVNGVRILLPT